MYMQVQADLYDFNYSFNYKGQKTYLGLLTVGFKIATKGSGLREQLLAEKCGSLWAEKALPSEGMLRAITALLDGWDGMLRAMNSSSWQKVGKLCGL